jgi:hypothetical protein
MAAVLQQTPGEASRFRLQPFRAGEYRFVHCRNQSVRAVCRSVRIKIVLCGHFPARAEEIRSVRDICGFVRANFPTVRAIIHLCGRFSICAGKRPICWRF